MAIEMRLDLKLAQKLVMTPQLQQAIKLLQLSRLEMSQVVYQEMMENPVLEDGNIETDQDEIDAQLKSDEERVEVAEERAVDLFDLNWENYMDGDDYSDDVPYFPGDDEKPSYEQTLSSAVGLPEHLAWQLRLMASTDLEKKLGQIIIGNIDDDGYLRDMTVEEIAALAGASAEQAEAALKIVQDLDPPGVAARDLRECLLIQARQLGLGGTIVEEIIEGHMEDLEKKKYLWIAKTLRVSVKDVQLAAKAIESLEPKPGRPFTVSEVQYIIPDVYVVKKDGNYVILLNDEGMPRLRINSFYKNLMRRGGDEGTKDYIESKMRSAQWLIKSIEQRNKTIYRTAESIVLRQKEFLEGGIDYLKPMILRDVAEDIGMHESTVSRVTTNKYVHTPQGMYELKYFFSGSIASTKGDDLSSITVRNFIQKAISEEDPKNPLNDRHIVNILKSRSIDIARRTVAKYRGELKIPPASVRKKPY
ncbi:MAG: RNA polymerase factor sigma-54 [Nitrospirota bacterium]